MNWHTLPAAGNPWPAWFPPAGRSGVYLIRRAGAVVYVGESHTGRLRKTLARHFQAWDGPTAGPTYPRKGTEVAVEIVAHGAAVDRQNALIAQLRPRDNIQGKPTTRRHGAKREAPQTWTGAVVEIIEDAFDAMNPF